MKNTSRMIVLAAAAAFSAVANAEDDELIPKKFQNASPEIRAAYGLAPATKNEPPDVDIGLLRDVAGRDDKRCATVKVSAPVNFHGRTLVEIPDITDPRLRLANQLMTAGCFVGAVNQLESVTRADPDNLHARYVFARMSWMRLGMPVAEQLLTRTLARHPDFTSAKVLLAGIRHAQEKHLESAALLAEAERKSPSDVWIYLGRMRIDALRAPKPDMRDRLLEIVRSPAFPDNVREVAGEIADGLQQSRQQYLELMWARWEIDSNLNVGCKAAELAFWLSEEEGRFGEVIKLLESPRAKKYSCLAHASMRNLLGQAYLMEASKISAGPSAANQHLLNRADQILNGDYTGVAAHAQSRPQYAQLKPFLEALVHPKEADAHGNTKLCQAIRQFNVAVVREQLEAGADPNLRCEYYAPVAMLVFMATRERATERRDIMRLLLEHGAAVTNMGGCQQPGPGSCREVLLPVMEEFVSKRK